SQLVATNGRIETRGDHAFGLQVDGDAKATLDGVVVVTSGAGAHGVQVLDGGQVELADVTTDTTGATISSVLGAGATGVQQVTAAHSNLTQNNGTFMQVSGSGTGANAAIDVLLRDASTASGDVIDAMDHQHATR